MRTEFWQGQITGPAETSLEGTLSKPGYYDPAEHNGTWKATFSTGETNPVKEVAIHVSVLGPTNCVAIAELGDDHSEGSYTSVPIEKVFTDIVDQLHRSRECQPGPALNA